MDNLSNFDFGNFKKWMHNQNDSSVGMSKPNPKGLTVESKVSSNRLLSQISIETGEALVVVNDFVENGGVILDIDGTNFLLEVSSGKFYVNRRYVKKA